MEQERRHARRAELRRRILALLTRWPFPLYCADIADRLGLVKRANGGLSVLLREMWAAGVLESELRDHDRRRYYWLAA